MAIFEIEGPGGQIFEIESDTTPTEAELDGIFQQLSTDQPAPQAAAPVAEEAPSTGLGAVGEFVIEEALPIAGGVAGFVAGGPVGSVAGVAGGRAATELLQNFFTEQDKGPAEIALESTVEGAFDALTLGVGKALKPVARPALKALAKATGKGKVAPALASIFKRIPKEQREGIVEDVATRAKRDFGVDRFWTRRLAERPQQTTKRGFLRESLDPETIKNVSKSYEGLIKATNDQFKKEVTPALQASAQRVPLQQFKQEFINTLGSEFDIEVEIAKKGVNKGKSVVSNIGIMGTEFKKPVNDLLRILDGSDSAVNSQKVKRSIDKILKSNKFINPATGSLSAESIPFVKTRGLINQELRTIPQYAQVSDRFRDIFSIADEFGPKLSDQNVPRLLSQIGKDENIILRESVEQFSRLAPKAKRTIDSALDEMAELIYSSPKRGPGKSFGGSVPGTGIRTGVQLPGPELADLGRGLQQAQLRGGLSRVQQARLGGAGALGAGILNQDLQQGVQP